MKNSTPVISEHVVSLRPARAGDLDAIATLWHRGWLDGHDGYVPPGLHAHRRPADLRRRVPQRIGSTTVATVDGGPVAGFVTVIGDEVEQLYVAAEWRGSGVADVLLAGAESAIAEHDAIAWLAVVGGNTRARRFYERCGWRDAGAFEHRPADAGGTVVPARRYEKHLGGTS